MDVNPYYKKTAITVYKSIFLLLNSMALALLWKYVNQISKSQLYDTLYLHQAVLESTYHNYTLIKTRDRTITAWFPISDVSKDTTFLVV